MGDQAMFVDLALLADWDRILSTDGGGMLVFWGAVTLMVIVPVVAHHVYAIRKAAIDADLKRDMIARGMSVEEIERVLGAGEEDDD